MTLPIQNLRTATADKRPVATGLAVGQIAINYNESDPAIYLRGHNNSLVKVAPTYIGATAPNSTPAVSGATGNSLGETWLDNSSNPPIFKIWNGSTWVAAYTIPSGAVLISPVFSGNVSITDVSLLGSPTATTAASGDSSTRIATTAFVNNEILNDAALKDGTNASGTWNISVSGKGNVDVALAGTTIGTRSKINFIEGSNVTMSVTDDSVNGEVDVTINSTAIATPALVYAIALG